MGDRAARGFVYTFAQIVGNKVLTLAGVFVLSYLLDRSDFGLVSMAYVVGGFASLIANAGVRDVLIRRWKEFDTCATPALWMSLSLGILATLLMVATAPLAATFFNEPQVMGLILVLSLQNIFNALAIVPDARLSIDLRFRTIAIINFLAAAGIMILSVVFASLGFGPYSYILPWPIVTATRAAIVWSVARPSVGLNPQLSQWQRMFGANARLLGAALFATVISTGDYIILGRVFDAAVLGDYFWAFNLSTQALQLLSLNLAAVLLPSLAKMQDESERLRSAFVRAAKALTLLAVPACLLQSAIADPLIRLVFPAEWFGAIPIVMILSAGFAVLAVHFSSASMLKAQGRFGTYLGFMGMNAALFLVLVYAGAIMGQGVGVASGVAAYALIVGPLGVYIAIRPIGGTVRETASVFIAPVIAGGVSFGAAMLASRSIPEIPLHHLVRAIVVLVVGSGVYLPLIWLLARPAVEELRQRLSGMFRASEPIQTELAAQ